MGAVQQIMSSIMNGYDANAQAYFDVNTGLSITEEKAWNAFVIETKGYGIYSKFNAAYPFLGGTEATHKINAIDPQDTDGAYRLTFAGGWTHSSTGSLPDGTTGISNTHLVPSTVMSQNDAHISYYSRTTGQKSGGDMGSANSGSAGTWVNGMQLSLYWSGNNDYSKMNQTATNTKTANHTGEGFFIGSRISSTESKHDTPGGTQTITANSTGLANQAIGIGGVYAGSTEYGDRECAFASIGTGLSDTERANLRTAVNTYQTALGRNV